MCLNFADVHANLATRATKMPIEIARVAAQPALVHKLLWNAGESLSF
jgi:hypothetical protein